MDSNKKYALLIPIIVGMSISFAFTKKKVPNQPTVPEPTKWEKIAGHYKVFDTTGIYLYEMDLVHIHNNTNNRDSIRWEHFRWGIYFYRTTSRIF
ncbi:hypothetical protein [Fluviicola taffensis]|uniref:Uncharacterized protein n=1 Tax=Fluviicola taffensis (strain DSM 16823 / NCIMB 13979 / RW262) TaxID=755732 RepID=F2IB42_FLUTR|nr:hypothetical protein [Fluviicola taffensis]AEA42125.1 hypothetical protein Fluta_0115 [Fluviicola taffensis DSM 16823]